MIRSLSPLLALALVACSPAEPTSPGERPPSDDATGDAARPGAPSPERVEAVPPDPPSGTSAEASSGRVDRSTPAAPPVLPAPAPERAPADPDRPVGPAVGPGRDQNGDGRITEDERPQY